MNKLILYAFLFLQVAFYAQHLYAQQLPFYNEILNFKKQDSISPPPQNAILFTGSSSFRKWEDVQSYFPGYIIVNRAFGGSFLPDVIRYANDIIIPYRPKQVVIYCGENDLASSDTVTARVVTNRFKTLFKIIRTALPATAVTYVSIKPSPSRKHIFPKAVKANSNIKSFLKKQKNTSFIDVYKPMLVDGRPIPYIFTSDSLHMNNKGYDMWQKLIQPYLIK